MQVNTTINIDVDKRFSDQPVFAKQVDNGTRFINVKLLKNGTFYPVTQDCIAVFRALKPDGHSIMNTATIESNGSVTVELTEQVLAVSGCVKCDVYTISGGLLSDDNIEILSSATFVLDVHQIPYNDNTTPSASEMTYLLNEIHSSEAWAHGREDFPERAEDNAKYWAEQAASAVTGVESISNKVTSLSASSTDIQYPSAKCVYDLVGNVETLLEEML